MKRFCVECLHRRHRCIAVARLVGGEFVNVCPFCWFNLGYNDCMSEQVTIVGFDRGKFQVERTS